MLNYKNEAENYENKSYDEFDYDLSENTSNNNKDKFKNNSAFNVKQPEVNKRNVSQLLKIRIIDSETKSPNGKQKTC